jgi:hypothetical protein
MELIAFRGTSGTGENVVVPNSRPSGVGPRPSPNASPFGREGGSGEPASTRGVARHGRNRTITEHAARRTKHSSGPHTTTEDEQSYAGTVGSPDRSKKWTQWMGRPNVLLEEPDANELGVPLHLIPGILPSSVQRKIRISRIAPVRRKKVRRILASEPRATGPPSMVEPGTTRVT